VARVSQQVLDESAVGAIFTNGDPSSNGEAILGGLDFNYLNSRFFGGRRLTGNAYCIASQGVRHEHPSLSRGSVALGSDDRQFCDACEGLAIDPPIRLAPKRPDRLTCVPAQRIMNYVSLRRQSTNRCRDIFS